MDEVAEDVLVVAVSLGTMVAAAVAWICPSEIWDTTGRAVVLDEATEVTTLELA